jgi:uncharacterized protein
MRTTSLVASTLAAGAAIAAAYTFLIEPRWLQVKRERIHIRRLPAPLEGLRIALLTDLHAGGATSLRTVRRACAMAMREAPDLVALTGDFASHSLDSFRPVLAALSGLEAPLGVYAVPGNHDHRMGIDLWKREIRDYPGIIDLTNRSRVLEVEDVRLCVAGVDDFYHGHPSLDSLPPVEERDVTVLLAHSPDQAEHCRRTLDSVDLIVSGHTHAGQIRLPWLGPIRTSVEHPELYEEGLRRRPWTQVYTSRGIGTVLLPARLLSRPEISILELTSKPRPPMPVSRGVAGRSEGSRWGVKTTKEAE